MEIIDAATSNFAETAAERLFAAEARLRAAVQLYERTPQPARSRARVEIGAADARAILRAILPATLSLGRTRRATLALHSAIGALYTALVDVRDPSLLPPAIAAAVQLLDVVGAWLDEARWRQATTQAGVAWRRETNAISAVMRQSSAAEPEQTVATAPPPIAAGPPKRSRKRAGQGSILLPLPGGRAASPATTTRIEEEAA